MNPTEKRRRHAEMTRAAAPENRTKGPAKDTAVTAPKSATPGDRGGPEPRVLVMELNLCETRTGSQRGICSPHRTVRLAAHVPNVTETMPYQGHFL